MSWKKYKKVQDFYRFNRIRSSKFDKDGNESVLSISDKTKFIDNARFMGTLLCNVVYNLTEVMHKTK